MPFYDPASELPLSKANGVSMMVVYHNYFVLATLTHRLYLAFYLLALRFLTDLAVNVKFCLNSNPISFCTNMKYNISTKGSFSMTQIEQIEKMIAANGGMIQTLQITDAGISNNKDS